MFIGANSYSMNDDEFHLLRDIIHRYAGLTFEDEHKYLFEHRLSSRLEELNLPSYSAYYNLLNSPIDGSKEMEILADHLTNNETYFFREERQLYSFRDHLVPILSESLQDRRWLRIWSAGCSSGEEPYTLAMLLADCRALAGWRIDIFACDISNKVLAKAKRGIYGQSSFRAIPQYYWDNYFTKVDSASWEIKKEIRDMVTFNRLNLVEPRTSALVMPCDVIFCRNVIIYFNQATRNQLLNLFYKKLRRGGYLLLGHSESLINVSTDFEMVTLPNDLVYRKPMGAK